MAYRPQLVVRRIIVLLLVCCLLLVFNVALFVRYFKSCTHELQNASLDHLIDSINRRHAGDGSLLENRESEFNSRKQVHRKYYRSLEKTNVNCTKLVNGDLITIKNAHTLMETLKTSNRNIKQTDLSTNCSNFRKSRGYIDHPLSESELNFPIAFGIAIYKDIQQVERLLRAMYRPHNTYCFHVDKKSPSEYRQQVTWLASCFDNIYMTQQSADMVWGEFSLFEAELFLMEEVLKQKTWKYYINLTGQEYPLKTNRELVAILETLHGANVVDGTIMRAPTYRWKMKTVTPPHNITLVKGTDHVAANRYYVNFCVNDQRAKDFVQWLNGTVKPEETFFASLNHNPHLNISGSFLGDAETYPLKPFFTRYTNWTPQDSMSWTRPCAGKYVRGVCILGLGDVNRAYGDVGLFVNKFHTDYQYLGHDCLEEVLHEKTWQQYLNDEDIDVEWYKHLDYVKYKL